MLDSVVTPSPGQLSRDTIRFVEEVERVGAAPASLISTRFDFRSIIDRRTGRYEDELAFREAALRMKFSRDSRSDLHEAFCLMPGVIGC